MKKFYLLLVFSSLLPGVKGQEKWKEMYDFHSVISDTFHPAEEGNLKPVKDSATALVKRAVAWQTAPVPKGYNKTVAAEQLRKLVDATLQLEADVKMNKPDPELKAGITKVHDIFHTIAEKCKE